MKGSAIRALAALVLIVALLAGCGTQPGPEQVTTLPPLTTRPPATAAPGPQVTEPFAPPVPLQTLDTASLTGSGLSIQRIFVCDAQTLLFFVSPVHGDGTIAESILVYSYSLEMGGFRPVSFTAGVVSLYPTGVLEDGTVTLVTLDSESYEPQSLVFLDPVTLEARLAALPQDDFYDLHISPNGRYAAITTHDYLRVTDLSYGDEYWRMERVEVSLPAEGDDEAHWDERLPAATGWSADSAYLCYKVVSWAEDCPPGLLDTGSWQATLVAELAGCALTPVGGGLYAYSGLYSDLPTGLYRGEGLRYPVEAGFLAENGALAAAVGHASGVLCLLAFEAEAGLGAAYVADATGGASLGMLSGGDMGLTFEQAAFLPDGSRLVLLARPVGGGARQVLLWDYRA